jgi:hypothetical protein
MRRPTAERGEAFVMLTHTFVVYYCAPRHCKPGSLFSYRFSSSSFILDCPSAYRARGALLLEEHKRSQAAERRQLPMLLVISESLDITRRQDDAVAIKIK